MDKQMFNWLSKTVLLAGAVVGIGLMLSTRTTPVLANGCTPYASCGQDQACLNNGVTGQCNCVNFNGGGIVGVCE
jgi:hypothetical protein